MKFKQIAKDVFRLGITQFVVYRRSPSTWTLGVLRDDAVILSDKHFYTRKYAGKVATTLKNEDFIHVKRLTDFGEAKRRPAPPRPFIELLRKL